MTSRKKKEKWTSGVLCRDNNKTGWVTFWQEETKEIVEMNSSGYWVGKREDKDIFCREKTWEPNMFLETYNKKDLPKKGTCIEVDMEL